jgi:tyrosyl-tRNA synthetase
VDRFPGPGAGACAELHFTRPVRVAPVPGDLRVVALPAGPVPLRGLGVDALGLASRRVARRLIAGGGVSLDGEQISDLDWDPGDLDGKVLRAGKRRYARLAAGA